MAVDEGAIYAPYVSHVQLAISKNNLGVPARDTLFGSAIRRQIHFWVSVGAGILSTNQNLRLQRNFYPVPNTPNDYL